MSERVALVTGGSRGIGKAIALKLAQDGFSVVATATSETGALAITQYFNEAGLAGEGHILDVSDADSVAALFSFLKERGMPEVLVNNAAITRDNFFMRMKDEQWESVIETNLSAVYRMIRKCVRAMIKAKQGRIINISSVVAVTGNFGQANYTAAKAGVLGLTKTVALELANYGITVNAVAPGFIDTDMTAAIPDAQKAEIHAKIPMQHAGKPADIANAVAFLASNHAGYITGETLHVNGGMYMG